jgi:hypothetical protein
VESASSAKTTIDWVHRILKQERDIVISSRPPEATAFQVENIRIAYVFYESGLSINVMYTIDDAKKRAVGFKLSDGMEVPSELAPRLPRGDAAQQLARVDVRTAAALLPHHPGWGGGTTSSRPSGRGFATPWTT